MGSIKTIIKNNWVSLFGFLLVSCMFLTVSEVRAEEDGEKLFKQNCAACHLASDKTLIGPGLKGIYDRAPSEEWLLKWVKNPDALIASGDAYANKIKDFSPTAMTPFGYLEDAEILAILSYVKNPPVKEEVLVSGESIGGAESLNEGMNSSMLKNLLVGLVVLLVVLVFVLNGVKKSVSDLVNEKHGATGGEEVGFVKGVFGWVNNHRGWTAVIALILLVSFLRWGVVELMQVGVYQGYKPEQPIAFSHKIHAGQNGINCVYCHTGAEKGKSAGIPSLNVCMNCHTYVSEGPSGTEEIAKIYKALDYNPETKVYGDDPKPVRWVRVHNLPDLAYFNHSQHVVVGKIECQQCHGEIQEMKVVEQHSPLTMGWCINCHRETSVQVSDNGYYEDLHKRTPNWHNGESVTVDKIGGLECAKCHY